MLFCRVGKISYYCSLHAEQLKFKTGPKMAAEWLHDTVQFTFSYVCFKIQLTVNNKYCNITLKKNVSLNCLLSFERILWLNFCHSGCWIFIFAHNAWCPIFRETIRVCVPMLNTLLNHLIRWLLGSWTLSIHLSTCIRCQSDSWQYNLQMSVITPWWGPLRYERNTDISHVHVNTHRLQIYKYELRTRPTNLTDHKSAYLWSHKSIAMQFVCWVLQWWLSLWATSLVSGLPPSDLCGRLMWIFMGYFVLVDQLLCCWYIQLLLGREISKFVYKCNQCMFITHNLQTFPSNFSGSDSVFVMRIQTFL